MWLRIYSRTPKGTRVRRDLFRWMAGLARRGYPLPEILESLDQAAPRYGPWLRKTAAGLREGASFGETLGRGEVRLDPEARVLIELGERRGALPQALALAGELREGRTGPHDLKHLWFIAGVILLVVLMMLTFVAPVFSSIFANMGTKLPALTMWTLETSGWVARHFWLVLPAFLLLVIGGWFAWDRRIVTRIMRPLPLAGRLVRYRDWWRLLYGCGVLMKAEVPLDEAFTAMGLALGRAADSRSAERIAARLQQGISPAEAVRGETDLPAGARWALSIADQRGDLPETLIRIGQAYREMYEDLDIRAEIILRQVLYTIMGVVVGLIVAAFYLPIFSIATFIG